MKKTNKMKKIITIVVLSTALLNCKQLSDDDRAIIEAKIALHQATFGLQWKMDSIDNARDINIAYLRLNGDAVTAKHATDSLMKLHYNSSLSTLTINQPGYFPAGDPHLTFDKFMAYCEKNKWQSAMKHADEMRRIDEKDKK
ncbi:MAG: hypothetical protein ABI863_09875 [Ginsengibacter sp.]